MNKSNPNKQNKHKTKHDNISKEMKDYCRNESKMVKTRRGGINHVYSKKVKNNNLSCLKIFSANCASLKYGKIKSLNAGIRHTDANIVTLQETHYKTKGKVQVNPSFVVFEAIRSKKGGGTLVAINGKLNPKLIAEYNEEFELLVVEIETNETSIRVISGYGPQETWDEDKRMPFFIALETEVERAENAGKSIIIELDANSKLGKKHIPSDPHDMSPNGALLMAIIERHNLIVGNASSKCSGTITRRRTAINRNEKSVIDFVLFSSDLKKHFVKMHIDEERNFVLTRIRKTKNGNKEKESDHNTIITEFLCTVTPKEEMKEEVYNLKNKECQNKFKTYTSTTNMLSSTVDGNGTVNDITNRLIKKIDGCIAINFKKRRINHTTKNDGVVDDLYDKMIKLKQKDDDESQKELEQVKKDIANESQLNFNKIKDELNKIKSENGTVNSKQLWKLKKALFPKSRDPPSAMFDSEGNLLTSNKAIQERALEVFKERLDANEIEANLKDLEDDTNVLCEVRLKLVKKRKTEPWTMEDLKFALKHLEENKSRDPEGYSNELFKETVAGDDLLLAVLKLMNLMKERQEYPENLEKCNITPLHKKASKKDYKNYRGVFRVQVLRSILDRLLYNDSYYTIDSNLTDGNVGARKQRGVRDNIFVMSAIINSVTNGNMHPYRHKSWT